ncbi:universal stress protein [Halobiforma nitratireducens]|uniref:UspA domain-containing protein n=1 Tax=Halobiforma nitratireducens JCM 10879 TaxID=1227454 RepID=M0LXZ3_9EURY|nr:universal stress protein [Halobiforma nitratireducens]EMA37229.1 UspA domain-containing protein [Halobiforma nitratireducens JCM 10879]
MSEHILVPYDGSAPSKDALEYALEKFPNADITALYVVPAPEGYWGAFDDGGEQATDADEARDRGRTILEEAVETAADHGHDLGTEVTTGQPDREIVEFADGEYDTIVIGSHGREGVSRVLLGSVAENVVRRSPVPVAVVR